MGLLNNYLTKTIPQNARNIWDAVKRAPSDLQALGSPQMNTQVRQAMNKPAALDKESAMAMAMDYLQTTNPMGGLLAHTVYHGSPHKFNKFDMSKIGTGEGAQAFGHGLYFAENPSVAKSYMNAGQSVVPQEVGYAGKNADQWYNFWQKKMDRNPNDEQAKAALYFWERIASRQHPQTAINMALDEGADWPELAKFAQQFDVNKFTGVPPSHLYKVDIPDESIPRMLDWDKPLSKQHPDVQSAFANAGVKANVTADDLFNELSTKYNWSDDTARKYANEQAYSLKGAHAYQEFANQEANRAGIDRVGHKINNNQAMALASERLKALGIPGIRYKDAMSRGTDAGTSNFVLFDDELARILEINGQPTGLLSWADEAKKVKK